MSPASITATSSPARVSITAVVSPVSPAPTMTTSCCAPGSNGEPVGKDVSFFQSGFMGSVNAVDPQSPTGLTIGCCAVKDPARIPRLQ
ncbi:hypothetical protein QFZ21_001976 [Microbacterium sp. W4I20]|nr:hypothetical protein [Microbacterium sp. W4I20]